MGEFEVGLCYYNGKGIKVNKQEAVRYFSRAALRKNGYAMAYLGIMYFLGDGVRQDYTLAYKFLSDAANINAVFAYRFLGQCYEFGLGTETNIDKAIFWYEKDTKSGLHHPDVVTHLKELKSK